MPNKARVSLPHSNSTTLSHLKAEHSSLQTHRTPFPALGWLVFPAKLTSFLQFYLLILFLLTIAFPFHIFLPVISQVHSESCYLLDLLSLPTLLQPNQETKFRAFLSNFSLKIRYKGLFYIWLPYQFCTCRKFSFLYTMVSVSRAIWNHNLQLR